MRRFYIALVAVAFSCVSAAHAQVNLPSKDSLKDAINKGISKGGDATGQGAGSDLLNSYKKQLDAGMPCIGNNTANCAQLPAASGSTSPSSSSSGGASSTSSSSSGSSSSTSSSSSSSGSTSSGGVNPPSTSSSTSSSSGATSSGSTSSSSGSTSSTSSSSGATSSGSTSSSSGSTSSTSSSTGSTSSTSSSSGGTSTGLTRDKLLGAIEKAVAARAANMGPNMTTQDLAGLIRYVKAMNMILELYDTPAGKPLIETLLNKLAGTTSSPIMDQAKLMVDSAREFNVLREVRREVGTDALAASIEDAKNNSSKLNRAITQTYEKLRTHYNEAKTPAEKERIAKVMTMLREQAENDVPGQVMRATLTPFTLGGKTMDYVSGKGIADMIEKTDPESFEDEAVDNKFGADIITQ